MVQSPSTKDRAQTDTIRHFYQRKQGGIYSPTYLLAMTFIGTPVMALTRLSAAPSIVDSSGVHACFEMPGWTTTISKCDLSFLSRRLRFAR